MTRPHTRMEIQTEILHKNFQLLQTQFGTPIMAVVKANAYGHGIAPIAQHLQQAGATMFGVATVDEGIALREAGITQGILVLTKLFAEEVSQALKHNLQVFVWEKEQIEAYHRAAQEAKGPLQV
ncbi:MAG: alanine racemase, partial [Bacteroidota bacterium]